MAATPGTAVTVQPIPNSFVPYFINESGTSIVITANNPGFVDDIGWYDLQVAAASDLTWQAGGSPVSGVIGMAAAGFANWPPVIGRPNVDCYPPRAQGAGGITLLNSAGARITGTVWIRTRAA